MIIICCFLLLSFVLPESSSRTIITDLNNQIPFSVNLENFELLINSKNNQKHYTLKQSYDNIPVFGRSIRVHYNINNNPSSMSSNFHTGKFENSIPVLSINDIKKIIINDFSIEDFFYKNIDLMYYIKNEYVYKIIYV